MIVANATHDNGQLLILGLSKVNVERLLKNQPVLIRRSSHGEGVPEGMEIAIIYGETERELQRQFEEHGLIDEHTKIHKDPRL